MTIKKARMVFGVLMAVGAVFAIMFVITRVNLYLFIFLGLMAAGTVISNLYDRCPHCNTYQNFPIHRGDRCYKCGEKLEK